MYGGIIVVVCEVFISTTGNVAREFHEDAAWVEFV
jgi:hypothetical protein